MMMIRRMRRKKLEETAWLVYVPYTMKGVALMGCGEETANLDTPRNADTSVLTATNSPMDAEEEKNAGSSILNFAKTQFR